MDYRSARDLPSFVEIAQQLDAFRLLRFAVPAAERPDVAQMRRDLDHLADTVDSFYELLGPRNWIYHDSISVTFASELAATAASPEEAESALIDHYNDPERLGPCPR